MECFDLYDDNRDELAECFDHIIGKFLHRCCKHFCKNLHSLVYYFSRFIVNRNCENILFFIKKQPFRDIFNRCACILAAKKIK